MPYDTYNIKKFAAELVIPLQVHSHNNNLPKGESWNYIRHSETISEHIILYLI